MTYWTAPGINKNPFDNAFYSAVEKILFVSKDDVLGKSRKADLVTARMLIAWAYRQKGYSLIKIGSFINRKHDSIIYYLNQVEWRNKTDKEFRSYFNQFKKKLTI